MTSIEFDHKSFNADLLQVGSVLQSMKNFSSGRLINITYKGVQSFFITLTDIASEGGHRSPTFGGYDFPSFLNSEETELMKNFEEAVRNVLIKNAVDCPSRDNSCTCYKENQRPVCKKMMDEFSWQSFNYFMDKFSPSVILTGSDPVEVWSKQEYIKYTQNPNGYEAPEDALTFEKLIQKAGRYIIFVQPSLVMFNAKDDSKKLYIKYVAKVIIDREGVFKMPLKAPAISMDRLMSMMESSDDE